MQFFVYVVSRYINGARAFCWLRMPKIKGWKIPRSNCTKDLKRTTLLLIIMDNAKENQNAVIKPITGVSISTRTAVQGKWHEIDLHDQR